jgi:hypothetical protein
MSFHSLQLEIDDGEGGNLLVRQRLQWGLEKTRTQKIGVGYVEVKIYRLLPRRSLHARERGTSCRDSKVEKWVQYVDGRSGWTPVWAAAAGALDVLGTK